MDRPSQAALLSRWMQSAAMVGVVSLAACSGGGGVGSTPTPPPAPTPSPSPSPSPAPAPAPTPTPTPTATYNTAEYRATVGAVSANALVSYQRGATGAGVKVGVIDSGIDLDSAEFPGRIAPESANVAGGTTIDDAGGHGTAVAFTLAGRRNDAGTQGIAFDATLVVARADTPGTCATTSTGADESGCSFSDSAIARGIDLATRAGARVINISLGGSTAGSPVVDAINRATTAGIVVVIAAGNDYVTDPATAVNPDPFAQVANRTEARGLVIVAGSVGANNARTAGADAISSFSNRAGNSSAHYLAAVGESVRAPDQNNVPYLWTGTSFASPQIAGAVALLAQAFPTLTGAQIVAILYASARDAGAAGVDAVYGQGVLDLTRAFQPIGTASLAGTHAAASLGSNAILSAPIGDARQGALGAVILDGFDRAFAIDLAQTIDRSGPSPVLTNALQSRTRNFASHIGGMSVALTVAETGHGAAVARLYLGETQARQAHPIAGTVAGRFGSKAQFAIGFAQGGASLTAQLAGRNDPAFLVAPDAVSGAGFASGARASTALRRQFGAYGVALAVENGDVLARNPDAMEALRYRYRRFGYDRATLAVDRHFGGLSLALSGTQLRERATVLGAHFSDALGATRATSWFVDGTVRLDAGHGWSIGGAVRQGWTMADVRGGISGGGLLRTDAYAADLGKDGLFDRGDSFGLRIAQPLRVAHGGIDLRLPTTYDYDTLAVSAYTTQRLNLAPTGREVDLEARYAHALWHGMLQTNLFLRRNPGNFAAIYDDLGAAMRWSVAF